MKIYTGLGDKGKSSIYGFRRLWKDDLIFDVLGSLDELNCFIGYCRVLSSKDELADILREIQLDIYRASIQIQDIEAGRSTDKPISKSDISKLERYIDKYWGEIGDLKGFIMPYGSERSIIFHITRTVCRGFERKLVSFLREKGQLNNNLIPYFNRLSDLLFTLARYVNFKDGYADEYVKED